MSGSDRELIQRVKQLLGGNQQTLAKRLTVTPSAISNWLAADRIPEASRNKVLSLLEQLPQDQPAGPGFDASRGSATASSATTPSSSDIQHCGFFAESAWCFNYLVPPRVVGEPADDEVWRTWKGLQAIRSTTFRHYFRYQLLHQGSKRAAGEGDFRGFGFLKDWPLPSFRHAHVQDTRIAYLDANAELGLGNNGCGGYFVRAKRSVYSQAQGAATYEFVGFRPECPVKELHLVLSLPRTLRGAGPMVAYLMSTDYPQYYDFASHIATNRGELDRLIEPWGRVVPVDRLRPEQLQEWSKVDAGAAGWGAEEQEILLKFTGSSQSEPSRDISIATVMNPPALTTLLMFWPLPPRG